LTYGNKTLAILYNPFSLKNHSPKWPDGLCSYSIGKKVQQATEIHNESDFVGVLFPGRQNWFVAVRPDGRDIAGKSIDLIANHRSDHMPTKLEQIAATTATPPTAGKVIWSCIDKDEYAAWRPVSTAVKFRHVNSDEENEGWFECVRSNRNNFTDEFGLYLLDDPGDYTEPTKIKAYSTEAGPGDCLPLEPAINGWMEAKNWTTLPTYATGKLKDIGRYIFQLNHNKRDNEFIKCRDMEIDPKALQKDATGYSFIEADTEVQFWSSTPAQTTAEAVGGQAVDSAQLKDFTGTLFADSFDVILIRFHGIEKTRILCHSVMNYELLVPEESKYSSFQTAAYAAVDALEAYNLNRQKFHKLPFHSAQHQYSNPEDLYFN